MREVEILALGLVAAGYFLLTRAAQAREEGDPLYYSTGQDFFDMNNVLAEKEYNDVTAFITSEPGKTLIIEHEGWRRQAYNDGFGNLTIGVGHLIVPGDGLSAGSVLTDDQVADLFQHDLWAAENSVMNRVRVPVTQGMFDALVDFSFQYGDGKFSRSTLLRKLNAGDYPGAAEEFRRWIYAGDPPQVVSGLVERREDNHKTFLA